MRPDDAGTLHISEIPWETGELRYRYSRRLSEDGSRWIRHGLFQAFHVGGGLASEGMYADGREEGVWRDFHENGRLAAEGNYREGLKDGVWRFWTDDGVLECETAYTAGEEHRGQA